MRVRLVFWHVLHLLLADKYVAVAIFDADSYLLCFDRLPHRFFELVRHMVTVIVQQLPNPIREEFVPCQSHLMTLWFRDQHHLLQRAVWDRLAVLPPWDPQTVVDSWRVLTVKAVLNGSSAKDSHDPSTVMQRSRDSQLTQRGDILDRSDILVRDSGFSLEEVIYDPLDNLESKSDSLTTEDEDDRLSISKTNPDSQLPPDDHTHGASDAASTLEEARKLAIETRRVKAVIYGRRRREVRAVTETNEQRQERLRRHSLAQKPRTEEQRRKKFEHDSTRRQLKPMTETQRLRRCELDRKRRAANRLMEDQKGIKNERIRARRVANPWTEEQRWNKNHYERKRTAAKPPTEEQKRKKKKRRRERRAANSLIEDYKGIENKRIRARRVANPSGGIKIE